MKRQLAAILALDMVGYSRLMAADEAGTVRRLKQLLSQVIGPGVRAGGGRIFKTMGDGLLAEFPSVVAAADTALLLHQRIADADVRGEDRRSIAFRMGLHLGDVVVDGDDFLGDGVNIAARLEELADPGSVYLSNAAYEQVHGKIHAAVTEIGPRQFKNLPQTIQVWRIARPDSAEVRESATQSETSSQRSLPSITVLPFENRGASAELDHLADGLADELIASLARTRWLFLIASGSSGRYRGPEINPRDVAADLGVRYVVQSSFMQSGGRIRSITKLIDGESGAHLGVIKISSTYDDVFDLVDDLAMQIAGEIIPEISARELQSAKSKVPSNMSGWELYLRALPLIHESTEASCERARQLLVNAVECAPDFAPAHARLATCAIQAGYYGWGGRQRAELITKAFSHARRALAADADEALAFDALASAHQLAGEFEDAMKLARKAIEISPVRMAAYGTLVTALAFLGHADEALEVCERSVQVSPRDPNRSSILMGRAIALFTLCRFNESAATAREHAIMRPNWYGSQVFLAAASALEGEQATAERAAARLRELLPDLTLPEMRQRTLLRCPEHVDLLLRGLEHAGVPAE